MVHGFKQWSWRFTRAFWDGSVRLSLRTTFQKHTGDGDGGFDMFDGMSRLFNRWTTCKLSLSEWISSNMYRLYVNVSPSHPCTISQMISYGLSYPCYSHGSFRCIRHLTFSSFPRCCSDCSWNGSEMRRKTWRASSRGERTTSTRVAWRFYLETSLKSAKSDRIWNRNPRNR